MASLRELGVIKALLLNGRNNTLVAGHQRLRACMALGIESVPCFVLDKIYNLQDEVKFNLYHNSIEMDKGCEAFVSPSDSPGFRIIDPCDILHHSVPRGAYIRSMLFKLYVQYGHFCNVVADTSGRVLNGHQYLFTMLTMWEPFYVYYVDTDSSITYNYLNSEYGHYHFDHIDR